MSGRKLDGIYRAELRGESTHMKKRAEAVATELAEGGLKTEKGKFRLLETRKEVERAWHAISEILVEQGQPKLAEQVDRFVARMRPARTEREEIAEGLRQRTREARVR